MRPSSKAFDTSPWNRVSISGATWPFTLKLSVLLSLGMNPCLLPFWPLAKPQSTTSNPLLTPSAVQPARKFASVVTHALYTPPLLGVSLKGYIWTVMPPLVTLAEVLCSQPPAGTTLVMMPPTTTNSRHLAASVDSRVLPDGSVIWKT